MTQMTYNCCCNEIGIKNGHSLIATFSKKILVNIPIPWLWENVNGLKSNYKNTSWHQVHRYLKKKRIKENQHQLNLKAAMSWSFYDPSMSASQHRPRMKCFVCMDQTVT